MVNSTTTTSEKSVGSAPRWKRKEAADAPPAPWHLEWNRAQDLRRHCRFVDEKSDDNIFPYRFQPVGETVLRVESTEAIPLSAINWRNTEAATKHALFKSLGQLLRRLHDLSAPSGFGDPNAGTVYRTFNAFMASEFTELGRRMELLDDRDVYDRDVYDRAVSSLATIRHELSAFHPHGKSTWTAGRLGSDTIAIQQHPMRAEAIIDLGAVALRPFEYDLGALSVQGLLFEDSTADQAFWKGYGVAMTCDLKRRIRYFERLIGLEKILGRPAFLGSESP